MNKPYTTLDICDYIIQKCNYLYKKYPHSYHYYISNFSLNPMLYILNKKYQNGRNGASLIKGVFEPWDYCMVIPEVWDNFKTFGGSQLQIIAPLKTMLASIEKDKPLDTNLHYHPDRIPKTVKAFLNASVPELYKIKPCVLDEKSLLQHSYLKSVITLGKKEAHKLDINAGIHKKFLGQ